VEAYLSRIGAKFIKEDQVVLPIVAIPEDDENVRMVRKLFAVFRRSTHVGESILNLRMGVHASKFAKELLPDLLNSRILEKVPHRGGGIQRRFRLGRSMSSIADALAESRGDYSEFLRLVTASPEAGAQ